MIPRLAVAAIQRLARGFPILALTGPRQSGKTTLAKQVFSGKPYVSLEDPDERAFAQRDPRNFLARFPRGALLDEAQRCPSLFSYLQGIVDARGRMGQFVLTGSQQFGLMAGIAQSLAGRVGLVELLPLSWAELRAAGLRPPSMADLLWVGSYPAPYNRGLLPGDWFAAYVATYLERDVRDMLAVKDLGQFQRFLKLCASRSGQLLNLSSLAADAGITHPTARHWLSVLEASYVLRLVPPYHRNFGKRLVKTPKLYFLDTGLMAWLLGIRDAPTLASHPLRGALFETWVVGEWVKARRNQGEAAEPYFWRDHIGHEVDLVFEGPQGLQAVEIKSGATFASDWPDALHKWQEFASRGKDLPWVVYGGDTSFVREGVRVFGWRDWQVDEAGGSLHTGPTH